MADLTPRDLFQEEPGTRWLRLHTLVTLRWVAVAGQVIAITVAQYAFSLDTHLGLIAFVIGLSVIANLISIVVYPQGTRLNELQAMMMLLFDLGQLTLLLYLTGGLHNPFAMLLVVPVTVAAMALSTRAAVLVGAVTVTFTSFLGLTHIPLRNTLGVALRVPDVFVLGYWVAIVIAVGFVALYTRVSHRDAVHVPGGCWPRRWPWRVSRN